MKKLFILFFSCGFLINSYSQEVLDKIAKETCDCAKTIEDNLGAEEFQMQLGICMLNAASPLSEELKEQANIDLNSLYTGAGGEEFGVQVGLKMAKYCPQVIMKAADAPEGNPVEEFNEYLEEYSGKINNIDKKQFVTFHILGEDGKTSKFIWLTEVTSSVDLANAYETLLNKNVNIRFETIMLFDVRINEYKEFNVLVELNLMN